MAAAASSEEPTHAVEVPPLRPRAPALWLLPPLAPPPPAPPMTRPPLPPRPASATSTSVATQRSTTSRSQHWRSRAAGPASSSSSGSSLSAGYCGDPYGHGTHLAVFYAARCPGLTCTKQDTRSNPT
ncbi:hypothetical protein U9M48_017468 [Paspalum notatum var. saurae]|uniref:Uncharacterized protein n=1 Tax=Paspalum notatum var. saurae TaxID=547442 RepID=A0AAQ3T7Z3_PASNO